MADGGPSRRGEQAMVAGEIGSGSGYQSCKLGEELKGLEDEVGGAIVEGVFQFIHHFSRFLGGQPIKGKGRSGDVSA